MSDHLDAWAFAGGEAHINAHAVMTGDLIADAYPELIPELRQYHPVTSAAIFAGLLGVAEIQSNCVRLEALIHLCLRFGEGQRSPSGHTVQRWFNLMENGPCGAFEDPAEDVFVSSVSTHLGNYRVLEGIWECGGFYLQRVLEAMHRYENADRPTQIARSIEALLILSDAFCERCGLQRHELGQERPLESLPDHIAKNAHRLGKHATFGKADLKALGIDYDDLAPFSLAQDSVDLFAVQSAGHTDLEARPLIFVDDRIVFALPTAVTAAVRRFVHETFDELLRPGFLADALAQEYMDLFSQTPLLGGRGRPDVEFRQTKTGMLAGVTKRIDAGRYINIVFVLDTLEGFVETGLIGADPDPNRFTEDIDAWIDFSYDQVSRESDFGEMMTIVVMCGIGRAVNLTASSKSREAWRFVFIDAADFYTLSLMAEFSPQELWRILDAADAWKARGVELFNANGLLNLVAWTRKLSGHLVPHPLITGDEQAGFDRLMMVVDQNGLRGLRCEAIARADEHRLRDAKGELRRVIRSGSSFFDADADIPLYHGRETASLEALEQVYANSVRNWWSKVSAVNGNANDRAYVYSWFELMKTWLPKMATALDECFLELKHPALSLSLEVERHAPESSVNSESISYETALDHLDVHVEPEQSNIRMRVRSGFERALSAVDNRAERAVIEAWIKGVSQLAQIDFSQTTLDALIAKIVPNHHARQTHRFASDDFRDRIRDSADRPSVKPDLIDEGALKIGLGWRVRERSEGTLIEGVEACRDYLNALSGSIIEELCTMLRSFDRKSVIGHCLYNHECSAIERARWQRTSAAIEALREGQSDVRDKIVKRHHEMNGASQGSRQLVELAICECPLQGGRTLGDIDLSRMLSRILMAVHLSAAADAIHKGAMVPSVEILPLGDVILDHSFHEKVVVPHAVNLVNSNIDSAIRNHENNYRYERQDQSEPSSMETLEPEFEAAFEAELGASIFDVRIFVEYLENAAYMVGAPVIYRAKEELLNVQTEFHSVAPDIAGRLVENWTLAPRSSWSALENGVKKADLYVGRFRRPISMLRRPLVHVEPSEDGLYMICPGIVRDAFEYQLRHFHKGDYRTADIVSPEMRAWKSRVDGEKGDPFEKEVQNKLELAGWMTRQSVNITELYGRSLDRNYGEIDVLAWRADTQQILIIECKNIAFRQSPGELADQLSDFQGKLDDRGKPDLLRKHLNRVDLFRTDHHVLTEFCGLSSGAEIRDALVFSVPVPMMFARQQIPETTEVLLAENINEQL